MYGLTIQLDVRRYPADALPEPLGTVRRLDGAASYGNSKAVSDALGNHLSMAKHLGDGPLVRVGFLAALRLH